MSLATRAGPLIAEPVMLRHRVSAISANARLRELPELRIAVPVQVEPPSLMVAELAPSRPPGQGITASATP